MVKDEIYSKSIIEYFYDFDIFNPMYLHDIVNIKDINIMNSKMCSLRGGNFRN